MAALSWRRELAGTVDAFIIVATYLCGFLVPVDVFPEYLKIIALLIPWTYCLTSIRSILYGHYHLASMYLLLLPLLGLTLLALGNWLMKSQVEASKRRGDLTISL